MQADSNRISAVAMRWMIVGEWRTYPGRVIVAALAIAVGVALGFAIYLINASALNEFGRAMQIINGEADFQVRAVTPLGFDEALYPRLARMDGIAEASPVVELPASVGNAANTSLTLIGLDILRAATVTPNLVYHGLASPVSANTSSVNTASANTDTGAGGTEPATNPYGFDQTAVFLSQSVLDATGRRVGDTLEFFAAGRTARFTVAGTLPAIMQGQKIGVIDIAAAQWRFGQLGRLQRIDLRLDRSANAERVKTEIAAILPPDAAITSWQAEARRSDGLSRAYRVNLNILALVALLCGSFLVATAQSLSVARRRAQFALLRVLGVQRRALVAQVLVEGAVVGSIGALIGLALGHGLADGALHLLGGDLGGGYFRGTRPELMVAPGAAIVFFMLGLAAALIGSALPARDAARAQPAVALKNAGDSVDPNALPLRRTALALLAAGAAAALLPAIGGLSLFGYLSIGLMLAGGIAAMPFLARMLLTPLIRLHIADPATDLALKRLWGAPSQAAIALCGIVASTSLMFAMAVMVWSFRGSVDEWLTEILPADVYFYAEGGNTGGFDVDMQRKLAAAPGVARIDFLKRTPLLLSPEQPHVGLIAEPIDRTDPARSLPLIGASLRVPAGAIPVWLSEPAVRLYGHRPGDWMTLPIVDTREAAGSNAGANAGVNGGVDDIATEVFVAGMWRDYARQHGAIAMDGADYTRLTGDEFRTEGAVELAPGATAGAVIEGLRAVLAGSLAGRVSFTEPAEIRAQALQLFDRSFAVTYLLELIAILVGLSGVAASFSAQTLARRKEFGMLRHIGVLRRQIVAMLAIEGALLGMVGVVAGAGLGLAMSQVLIHVVNPQSFHWTMETRLPLALFAVVAALLVISSAGAALLAGRRALSSDLVRAVQEDW